MPHLLTLAPFENGDVGRLRGWLHLPEVQSWWGSLSRAEAEIALALDSPSSIRRIVQVEGVPIGYGHALDSALLGAVEGAGGSWACSLFIASEAHRGRGLGRVAVEMLAAEVFQTTLAVACTMRVPITKEPTVRALEAAGFHWVGIEPDQALGRVWIMRTERPRT